MNKNFKKIISLMLVLCLATLTFVTPAVEAEAASKYSKSFTKKITLQPWEHCEVSIAVKKKANVTVKVSTTSKYKDLSGAVTFWEQYDHFAPNKKSITLKKSVSKGNQIIGITNYTDKKITYTVKVSAKSAVVKYKKKEFFADGVG